VHDAVQFQAVSIAHLIAIETYWLFFREESGHPEIILLKTPYEQIASNKFCQG